MKHFLHILVLTLILALPLRVCADTVTFDFTTDGGLNALGIVKPKQGKATNLLDKGYSLQDVTLTQKQNNASMPTRIWNSKGSIDLRTYPNSELTLSVPAGKQITSIVFTGKLKSTCNSGALNGLSWTNNNSVMSSVTFKASATNNINTITVNYSATQPTEPIAKVNSIKELKALASGTKATLTFTDGNEGSMARVLYAFGTGNTQEAYVRDATGAVCFYGINPNVPFVSNQHLAGQITGEYVVENGVPYFKAIPNVTNTSLLVIAAPVTEQAVQPKEIEAKNYLDNTADWVCLKNLTLVDDALTTQDDIVINNRFGSNEKYTAPYQGAIIDLAGIAVPNSGRKEINPIYLNNHRPVTFVIDEEKAFVLPQSDITDAAVRLKRTFSADHWDTFAVPFDIEAKDLAGAKIATFTKQVEDNTMIFDNKQTQIEAGKPYLIKWNIENPTFEGITLKATTPETVTSNDGQYSFVAVYSPKTLAVDKTERYLSTDESLNYPVSADNKANLLKGLHAYYRVPATATVKISFSSTPNAITRPYMLTDKAIKVYNLNGQYVGSTLSNLPKGVYIVNGHKLIIK
ncbi:hypothetical protein KZY67_03590 [Prevotella melaninogenica]|uniref:hypothetical protein n=1 Tax=Prevotella melaninogenica TaxID=28132 RepID=UPI001C5E34A2|nr:hypothetical protein [Prevotella melaninogenica]MBW4740956.1 hypothetical protein [Prevotella melaninogenica]MBW4911729.1 hypothetical protein [Prevotella melaninogenica]